jgi:hypothetical protein
MKSKLIAAMLIIAIVLVSSGCIETGKGISQDTLYGLEYDGIFWKTYSVWLTNDHPYTYHSAIYSIANNDVETLKKVQDAIANKTTVKVLYRNELLYWPWDYSSGTIIYDIQKVD